MTDTAGVLAAEVALAHRAASIAAAENINVSFSSGGLAFATKQQRRTLTNVEARLSPKHQRMTLVGNVPTPWKVTVDDSAELASRLRHLRSGARRLRWQPEDLGVFAGAAIWTYLMAPLLLDRAERIHQLPDAAGLRRLRMKLPPSIAGHGSDQTLHIRPDGLIGRHDYTATAFGSWARATQVITVYEIFDHVPIGTSRRVTPRLGRPMPGPTLVWIDIHSVLFTGG